MIVDAPGTAPGRAAIVVDAMGGDHGPAQVVAGAAAAATALQAPVILTGRPPSCSHCWPTTRKQPGYSNWSRPTMRSPWTRGR